MKRSKIMKPLKKGHDFQLYSTDSMEKRAYNY